MMDIAKMAQVQMSMWTHLVILGTGVTPVQIPQIVLEEVLLEELLEVVQAMTLVLMQEMDGVMMQHTGPLMDMTCVILEQMTQTVRVVDIIKL